VSVALLENEEMGEEKRASVERRKEGRASLRRSPDLGGENLFLQKDLPLTRAHTWEEKEGPLLLREGRRRTNV